MNLPEIRGWSLHQPWANLVAHGLKKKETRSKGHPYRGWVAIHASKAWDATHEAALQGIRIKCPGVTDEAFRQATPFGAFIAIARITNVYCMTPARIAEQTRQEIAMGDWRPGRFAYELADVTQLEANDEARGLQGLWRIDPTDYPHVAETLRRVAGA